MSLHKALKNLKFDKRLTEYNLNKGLLSQDEFKKHLESLQDVGSKIDLVDFKRDSNHSQEPN
ncbi:MAG: hypothetical protein ACK5V3_14905 [Bdellovibrionales bacterium]